MPQFLKDRLRDGVVILALAAAFTFFGVYSSGEGSVWLRFAMWMVTMIVGAAASNIVIPLVFDRHLVGDRLPVKILVSAALIAVPVTVTLYLFMGLLGNWVPPDDLPVQYLYVYAICLVLTLAGVLLDRAAASGASNAQDGADPAGIFLERLPVKYRGAELWAVSSEDHYLRVHTDRGEELILMRLADAMRELNGAGGLQTHRSWWVAKDGVADTKRDNGKLVLVLKSGKEAPVSRTFQPDVRKAGLA